MSATKELSVAAAETLAIGMIGDGIVAGTIPRRHVGLWNFRFAPGWYRRLTSKTARRPMLVRAIAVTQVIVGAWVVYRLTRPHA